MMSRRYQRGCLLRQKRKSGPDVWVLRWRDGEHNPKEQIGTVVQLPTKSAATEACELLRANINRETRVPRTFGELADHYSRHELPPKTPYYGEVCAGYLKTWILHEWEHDSLSAVKAVSVESRLKTLTLADGTKAKLRISCTRFSIMRCVGSSSIKTQSALYGNLRSDRESPMC